MSTTWLLILVPLMAALAAVGVHYLFHRHNLSGIVTPHMVCGCCGRIVARHRQLDDSTIQCANCERAEDKEAGKR
jgi:hypothetical protein